MSFVLVGIDTLILCFALWLFARHNAEYGLHQVVYVALGINVGMVLISIGLTLWLGDLLTPLYITLVTLVLSFIIGVLVLCKFCYTSILQASKAFILFLIIRACVEWARKLLFEVA